MPLWDLLKRGGEDQPPRLAKAVGKTRERWLSRLAAIFGQSAVDEGFWDELEEMLLTSDVGVSTTQHLLEGLRERSRSEGLAQPSEILDALKEAMVAILSVQDAHGPIASSNGESPTPLVVLVVGVNGVGKTTSIAKMVWSLKSQGRSVLLGAADTFRAAGVEQLQVWAQRLGVEVIAHQPGSDPGGVAYDALSAAQARGVDVLVVDTAGRLHTRHNLMEELRKVHRVVGRRMEGAPHEVWLVLDATTGQNGLAQAKHFAKAVGCTGVFLAKMDGTAKGGIVLAICHELGLPILFVGTGEELQDMAPFGPEAFVDALLTPTSLQAR